MGDCCMDGPDAPFIKSAEEMGGRFQTELMIALPGWKKRLQENPDCLVEIERDVHKAFARGADMLVSGLIAMVMKTVEFAAAAEQLRQNAAVPLSGGRERQIRVRLLGGLVLWIRSLYCAPRKRWFGRAHEQIPGIHVELAQFGFGKGCTPGLQSRVARQAALCPSLQFAQQELERSGVKLDVKAVGRISRQCGEGMLQLRTQAIRVSPRLRRRGRVVRSEAF